MDRAEKYHSISRASSLRGLRMEQRSFPTFHSGPLERGSLVHIPSSSHELKRHSMSSERDTTPTRFGSPYSHELRYTQTNDRITHLVSPSGSYYYSGCLSSSTVLATTKPATLTWNQHASPRGPLESKSAFSCPSSPAAEPSYSMPQSSYFLQTGRHPALSSEMHLYLLAMQKKKRERARGRDSPTTPVPGAARRPAEVEIARGRVGAKGGGTPPRPFISEPLLKQPHSTFSVVQKEQESLHKEQKCQEEEQESLVKVQKNFWYNSQMQGSMTAAHVEEKVTTHLSANPVVEVPPLSANPVVEVPPSSLVVEVPSPSLENSVEVAAPSPVSMSQPSEAVTPNSGTPEEKKQEDEELSNEKKKKQFALEEHLQKRRIDFELSKVAEGVSSTLPSLFQDLTPSGRWKKGQSHTLNVHDKRQPGKWAPPWFAPGRHRRSSSIDSRKKTSQSTDSRSDIMSRLSLEFARARAERKSGKTPHIPKMSKEVSPAVDVGQNQPPLKPTLGPPRSKSSGARRLSHVGRGSTKSGGRRSTTSSRHKTLPPRRPPSRVAVFKSGWLRLFQGMTGCFVTK